MFFINKLMFFLLFFTLQVSSSSFDLYNKELTSIEVRLMQISKQIEEKAVISNRSLISEQENDQILKTIKSELKLINRLTKLIAFGLTTLILLEIIFIYHVSCSMPMSLQFSNINNSLIETNFYKEPCLTLKK